MLALAACGAPRLPHPRYVQHPTSALTQVPYPPPPPLVENIPDVRTQGAVWVDGEWRYARKQWRWHNGYWTLPIPSIAFSPAVEVRGADGTLWYAPGTWRDEKGEAIDDPEALQRARGHATGSVINASGEHESVGRGGRPPGRGGAPSGRP